MQRVCENANTFRHFACAARSPASVCARGRLEQRERGREGECCSRVAVTGAVAGADTVAGLGANVFTPKRFRVHGDTLVWRPLTVNTYIWMCSYAQQIATPLLSSSLSLSLSLPPSLAHVWKVPRCAVLAKCKRRGQRQQWEGVVGGRGLVTSWSCRYFLQILLRGRKSSGNFKFEYVFLSWKLAKDSPSLPSLPLHLFAHLSASPSVCLTHLSLCYLFVSFAIQMYSPPPPSSLHPPAFTLLPLPVRHSSHMLGLFLYFLLFLKCRLLCTF